MPMPMPMPLHSNNNNNNNTTRMSKRNLKRKKKKRGERKKQPDTPYKQALSEKEVEKKGIITARGKLTRNEYRAR
jgi:hypothetical protein